MIQTDVRMIKRTKDGYTSRTKTRGAKDMCRVCGNNGDCKKQSKSQGETHECKDYQFPIAFRDPKGLVGNFNTMRLGSAWSRRVEVNDTVALVNKEGQRIGRAVITEVCKLPKDEALIKHGERNHLMQARERRSDLSVLTQMEKIMRASYGNLIYNHNDTITIIYLKEQREQ